MGPGRMSRPHRTGAARRANNAREARRFAVIGAASPSSWCRRWRARIRSATSRRTSTTEVVASGDRLYVLSVLDLAEVPTFQAEADRTAARERGLREVALAATSARRPHGDGRRQARHAGGARAAHRASHAASQGSTRHGSRSCSTRGRSQARPRSRSRTVVRVAHRLARDRRSRRARCGGRRGGGSRDQREQSSSRVPQGLAAEPARRESGELHRRRLELLRRRAGARARVDRRARARAGWGRRRVRVARRARGSESRLHPRRSRPRDVLGCGARAHARSRQGDRRRLSHRDEGPRA